MLEYNELKIRKWCSWHFLGFFIQWRILLICLCKIFYYATQMWVNDFPLRVEKLLRLQYNSDQFTYNNGPLWLQRVLTQIWHLFSLSFMQMLSLLQNSMSIIILLCVFDTHRRQSTVNIYSKNELLWFACAIVWLRVSYRMDEPNMWVLDVVSIEASLFEMNVSRWDHTFCYIYTI